MGEGKSTESFGSKVSAWFKGLKAEFGKITWENKDSVTRQTVAVVVISVIVGVLIALIDMALQFGIDKLINL